jgi:glyoxylase-like metal-dependent hydrolase (beta-lactamase superfamily II)
VTEVTPATSTYNRRAKEIAVTRTPWIIAAALLAGACSQAAPEVQIINDAAEALGGRDRVLAVRTLVLEGTGVQPNIGQNMAPEAELPVWNVTAYRRVLDLERGRMRVQLTREPGFVFVTPQQRQDFGLDGDAAYGAAANGTATRASERTARERRVEMLHHPLTVVRAALQEGADLSNARTGDGGRLVDIRTASGDTLTLAVDAGTGLPARVVSQGYHANLGDVTIETAFEDYADVDGLRLPSRLVTRLDASTQSEWRLTRQTVDGDAGDAAAPEDVLASAAAPDVPPQNVTVEAIGRGVWRLAGGSHHSVLLEFADHLTLFEVPQSEARALAVIARAREIRPDKPVTHAIISHHHFDHTGGLRAAVSEDLTIVTHERSAAAFRDWTERPHSVVQDALTRSPKPIRLETFGDEHDLRDDTMEVRLYHVPGNPHADTLIMAYVPHERLLIQGDMYEPAPQFTRFPFVPSMADRIQQLGLRVDRHVSIHSNMTTHAEFLKIAAQARAE